MRDFLNKTLHWLIIGFVGLFLLSGGWRVIYRFFARGGPQLAGVGPIMSRPVSPELNAILTRHSVSSQGIVQGSSGNILTLTWGHPSGNLGEPALQEAVRRHALVGYQPQGQLDIRNIGNRQVVIGKYAIW